MLVPCVAPKFSPVIVTEVPGPPEIGETSLMLAEMVKVTELLAYPPTVTITGPVVTPEGTGATIEVPVQPAGAAAIPLKVRVLAP